MLGDTPIHVHFQVILSTRSYAHVFMIWLYRAYPPGYSCCVYLYTSVCIQWPHSQFHKACFAFAVIKVHSTMLSLYEYIQNVCRRTCTLPHRPSCTHQSPSRLEPLSEELVLEVQEAIKPPVSRNCFNACKEWVYWSWVCQIYCGLPFVHIYRLSVSNSLSAFTWLAKPCTGPVCPICNSCRHA